MAIDDVVAAICRVFPNLDAALCRGIPLADAFQRVADLHALAVNALLELEALRVNGDLADLHQHLPFLQARRHEGQALLAQRLGAGNDIGSGELLKAAAGQLSNSVMQHLAVAGVSQRHQGAVRDGP